MQPQHIEPREAEDHDSSAARSRRTFTLHSPLLLAVALIVLPGLWIDAGIRPIPPNTPPVMDAFFASVRLVTPPTARILIAGTPPGLVFYRATYQLYPRVCYTAFPIDSAHAGSAPPTTWHALEAMARRDGATYVLLWGLPIKQRGIVESHDHAGTLVRLGS